MRRVRRVLSAAVLASAAMLVAAPAALAGDTPCVGTVTGPQDNIVVPPGQTCVVTAATVQGSIKALQDSRLFVHTNPLIRGNVIGDKAEVVQVNNNPRIEGQIEIKEGESQDPNILDAQVSNNTLTQGNIKLEKMFGEFAIGRVDPVMGLTCGLGSHPPGASGGNTLLKGNIQVFENSVDRLCGLQVNDNDVAQDLQVFKTRGVQRKLVTQNRVGENLQCFDNDPPFVGQPNVVGGNAQGQCAPGPGATSLQGLPEEVRNEQVEASS